METVFTKMTENQAKLGADIYPTTNPGYTTKISYIDEITTEKNTLRDKYTSYIHLIYILCTFYVY